MNPNVNKITGLICGYRVEDIEDPLMQQDLSRFCGIRYTASAFVTV